MNIVILDRYDNRLGTDRVDSIKIVESPHNGTIELHIERGMRLTIMLARNISIKADINTLYVRMEG